MVYHSNSRCIPVASMPEGAATPRPGMTLYPDEWPPSGGRLIAGDAFDREFLGTALRVETGQELIPTLAVKVAVTGRMGWLSYNDGYVVRCKVEFLRDGEASVITGGWLYFRPWR